MCNHIFHKNCLDSWLLAHQNCPYCRTNMTLKDLEEFRMKMLMDDTNMPLVVQEIKGNSMEVNGQKNNDGMNSNYIKILKRN